MVEKHSKAQPTITVKNTNEPKLKKLMNNINAPTTSRAKSILIKRSHLASDNGFKLHNHPGAYV